MGIIANIDSVTNQIVFFVCWCIVCFILAVYVFLNGFTNLFYAACTCTTNNDNYGNFINCRNNIGKEESNDIKITRNGSILLAN